MTQQTLPFRRRLTKVEQVAELFRARPNVWIDGRAIADIGGAYAWRTRISDLRQAPFGLRIENRQHRRTTPDGRAYVVSLYRYVPAPELR